MGGSSNTGSSEFKPPKYTVPYSKDALRMGSDIAHSPFQPYGGQRIAGFTPFQQQGFGIMGNQAVGGNALTGMGMGSLADTVSGQYLNGNPYLDAMVGQAQGDLADQYRYATGPANMAMASRSGSLDNSGVAGKDMMDRFGLARAMGDVENQLRYGNYAQERQNQLGATGQALDFGQQSLGNLQRAGEQQQALAQSGLDVGWSEFLRQLADPTQKLQTLQGAVQSAQGGYGTTQNAVPNWAIGSTLGGSILSAPRNSVGGSWLGK